MRVNKKQFAIWVTVMVLVAAATLFVLWFMTNNKKDNNANANQPATECRDIDQQRVCTSEFMGLSEKDAVKLAKDRGLTARVVERDGESFPITLDLQEDRLNFTILNDAVVKVEFY